jgi:L-lactate dehydrogenase complex protein LldG
MDEKELKSMRNSFKTVYEKRKNLLNNPQVKQLQEEVSEIRKKAIENNEELIEITKKSFNRNDIDCFIAKDDADARNIIYDIIKEENPELIDRHNALDELYGSKFNTLDELSDSKSNTLERIGKSKSNTLGGIAKSKSNTLGEIAISKFLRSKNIDIIETDLGDRILQLKKIDNKPTHPTGPASHLNVKQIADIVNQSMGTNVDAEPKAIMEVVREDVRNKVANSKIGLSGANAVSAEDGSIIFIHNEGNISLISLMKTHIIVVGIDKLVNTIEDAIKISKLETVYATGSMITSYINIVSGPSKTADIEKKLLKNMYGAERVIVILLDNGRKEAIANIKECLWCIGCGSCIITCPVYNAIGNEFGFNNYLGGRGVAMSKFIEDSEISFGSGLYKCTLCGLCTLSCPLSIPTSEIIEKVRSDSQKEGFYPKIHEKFKNNIKNRGSPF